jgi:hypothetical protein
LYRLALVANNAAPIVDKKMRPLVPLDFAWDFQVKRLTTGTNVGAVTVSPAPFAV